MMKLKISEYVDFRILAGIVVCFGFASCNAGSGLPSSPSSVVGAQNAQYTQIERLARPAIKEAFENFSDHDTTNNSNPYDDTVVAADIKSFTGTFRQPQFGTTLAAILVPDELQANLGQSAAAGAYLGVETNGATGNMFGGRDLTNDVIDTSLGAIFGKTLVTVAGVTDDNQEAPCLTTDNEPGANTADGNTTIANITAKNGVSSTFPYLGAAQ
jgi:hypothetical protein